MAYGRVATGYQAGAPNLVFPGVPPSVNSDRLTSYEVGLKSTLLDRRVILNFSVFDLEWKNIQVTRVFPAG